MTTDSARLRQLEQERDAWQTRAICAETNLQDAMFRIADVDTEVTKRVEAFVTEHERQCKASQEALEKTEKERDAAVAACAELRMHLERCLGNGEDTGLYAMALIAMREEGWGPEETEAIDRANQIHNDAQNALATDVGARLLEERRLLRAFVELWDRWANSYMSDCPSAEIEAHRLASKLAREALRRFDEGTKR